MEDHHKPFIYELVAQEMLSNIHGHPRNSQRPLSDPSVSQ